MQHTTGESDRWNTARKKLEKADQDSVLRTTQNRGCRCRNRFSIYALALVVGPRVKLLKPGGVGAGGEGEVAFKDDSSPPES